MTDFDAYEPEKWSDSDGLVIAHVASHASASKRSKVRNWALKGMSAASVLLVGMASGAFVSSQAHVTSGATERFVQAEVSLAAVEGGDVDPSEWSPLIERIKGMRDYVEEDLGPEPDPDA